MKKIFIINFVFLVLFFMCVNCYAANRLVCEPFSAKVVKNNAKYLECIRDDDITEEKNFVEKEIGNNEELNIIGIIEKDNIKYGKFIKDTKKCYIDINDIKSNDVFFDDINNTKSQEILVVAKDGIELRKGPSKEFYSVLTNIPQGTKLTAKLSDTYGKELDWVYVEYKDFKGWINVLNNEVGFYYENESKTVMIVEKTVIKDSVEGKEIGVIEPKTIVNVNTLVSLENNTLFTDKKNIREINYIEYDGIKGFINIEDYALECNYEYTLTDEADLYEFPNDNSKIIKNNIPKGTKISYTYYSPVRRAGTYWKHGHWANINYNGKDGWVQIIDDSYVTEKNDAINDFEEMVKDNSNSKDSSNTYKIVIIVVLSTVLVALVIVLGRIILKKENK